MSNSIFVSIVGAIAVFFYIESEKFPKTLLSVTSSPEAFPCVILALIVILCAFIAIRDFKKSDHFVFRELFTGKTGIVAITLPIYIVCIQQVGFCIASFFMLVFVFSVLSPQQKTIKFIVKMSVLSVILTASVFYIFNNVFRIMLPVGALGC